MDEEFHRVTSTFTVLTEDGRTYEIEETTRYMRIAVVGGDTDTVRIDRHYQTTSGLRVCKLSEDTFGILDSDLLGGTDAAIAKRHWVAAL